METDNIKLAWKELNEKINVNELANKKTLAYILNDKRKTAWQRLILTDKLATLGFLFLTIVLGYLLFRENYGSLIINVQAVSLMFIVTIFNFVSFLKISQLDFNSSVLVLYRQVSFYKRLTVWAYIVSYVLAIVFGISLILCYPQPQWAVKLILLILPICIIIDYAIFHRSSNLIHTLVETTKELKELEQWNK